jgi:ribonuclease BN (tRNA processing enzyme)
VANTICHDSQIRFVRWRAGGWPCDSSELVQLVGEGGLDVLVHQATMENRLHEKAVSVGHSTPGMAARVAEQCGACHIV